MQLDLAILGLVDRVVTPPERRRDKMIIASALGILDSRTNLECAVYLYSESLTRDFYTANPEFAVVAGLVFADAGSFSLGESLVLLGFRHGRFSVPEVDKVRRTLEEIKEIRKTQGRI